jgi:hypothetical protein
MNLEGSKPVRFQPADHCSAAITLGFVQVPLSLDWQQNATEVSLFFLLLLSKMIFISRVLLLFQRGKQSVE